MTAPTGKKKGRPPKAKVPAVVPEVRDVAFVVEGAETARELLDLNGPKLVKWAFERAAQAPVSGNYLDGDIAKLLIHKLVPAVNAKDLKLAMPADIKRNIKGLLKIAAAMDAEYKEIPSEVQNEGS